MGSTLDFKVVIAGGSITGLTLANMLQLYGIDFVVLEAYPDIAPQVGASIGILPYGNRILDQLGLFQGIMDLCPPVDSMHFRNETGNVIREFWGMDRSMRERHGYPISFLDRQMVLQLLYDNIRDKSKILTNKRVQRVDLVDQKVVAHTTDGSTYYGDILVGGDGIHSTVRKEMWRLANKLSPGWIAPDEHSRLPSDYGCVFGISTPCTSIAPGTMNPVIHKHTSYLVIGGPGGRVYWFFFFKLPQRAYGDDIPVFTKEDEKRVLAAHGDDNITPTLKFQQIIDNQISVALVPLQEYVFRKWHFNRILTIGDSAHKVHPIGGQGGNACIESAATFVNNLRKLLAGAHSARRKPTLGEIENIFAATQETREARATTVKQHSHAQQRFESRDTFLYELAVLHLLPRADVEDITFNFSRNIPMAEKLDSPTLKPVPRLVPYKDELLTPPKPRGAKNWYFMGLYLAIGAVVYYGMWIQSAHFGIESHLGAALTTGKFEFDDNFTLKRSYTGIAALDQYLVMLTAIFVPGLKSWDPNYWMLQLYFLGMLVQPVAVWTVEAFRKRNTLTPLTLISIWLTLVQSTGIGFYMPIYYAMYTYISDTETYWWPLNREVPHHYAEWITTASIIGYVVPTILMFTPWKDPDAVQNWEVFWQVSPMLVPIFTTILGRLSAPPSAAEPHSRRAAEIFPDIAPLKKLYVVTGILGFMLHVYCLVKIISSPELTFAGVFWSDFSSQPKPFGEGLRCIFLADFLGFELASFGWLCMAVWDLKRVGRTNAGFPTAVGLIVLGTVFAGPGAAMSAVWYWRETRLAKTTFC
ncbi:hypothetical protein BJY00DRAFT_304207 [Aspergillus carlsbadensis]|nr:hypothetical protein BJY00DRAFT_304207 [Aspergillus carlsbadensis]